MVAVCPTHHTELGKLPQHKAYTAKNNPINIRRGLIQGYLGGNKSQKAIRLGGIVALNCRSVLDFSGISLFSYKMVGGEFKLDVFLPDQQLWPEIEVKSNEMKALTAGFWDIEYKVNWVKFRRAHRDIFLEIDFRKDEVEIDGRFNILGTDIDLKMEKTQIGTNTFSQIHVENCGTGLRLGPKGRILRPNFAMATPTLKHFPFM
ncbi:MAG: hypothetical protein ABJE81_02580 [Pseudophaeobacter sp.]|jgi:hypothetical protein|uniref:Uncharacterized protein n=2 Tax=Pseudophaeobacter TaxID=1541822 RepID=A0ABQ0AL62_9RHOB